MEDDNRVTAHPVLMLTIHEGFLWCSPLRWPKIFQVLVWTLPERVQKVLSHNNSILLPKPHRAAFYMEVKKGRIPVAAFVLPFSAKLKETNTPKSNGMTHRIHYNTLLVYHNQLSWVHCGQPANSIFSHRHRDEVSTASPSGSRTHYSPELDPAWALIKSGI